MRKIVFAISLILVSLTSNGQTNADSLFAVWQDGTQSDSTRTEAFCAYVYDRYVNSKPDTVLVLAEALIDYAEEHKDLPWRFVAD